jgi:hypothetical protein
MCRRQMGLEMKAMENNFELYWSAPQTFAPLAGHLDEIMPMQ